jgi:SAM-dependent methyltransferase
VHYTLTGVDIDEDALNIRKNERRDLDEAIVGDLRSVELEDDKYDVIYDSYVLEHIRDAERVLDNLLRWLRPGGILILRIPNRDSVYGFITRITPLWVHVLFKKYLLGFRDAGKPGLGPFPTVYDKVVSRDGIHRWCDRRAATIQAEYGSNYYLDEVGALSIPVRALVTLIHIISLGRLASDHNNLTFVIEKPVQPPPREKEFVSTAMSRDLPA